MQRVTKTEVHAVFVRLCAVVGVPIGGTYDPATRTMSRGWKLEHNGTYGGWIVRSYDGHGTGEGSPLGEYRMPAREFVRAMHMAIHATMASREQH